MFAFSCKLNILSLPRGPCYTWKVRRFSFRMRCMSSIHPPPPKKERYSNKIFLSKMKHISHCICMRYLQYTQRKLGLTKTTTKHGKALFCWFFFSFLTWWKMQTHRWFYRCSAHVYSFIVYLISDVFFWWARSIPFVERWNVITSFTKSRECHDRVTGNAFFNIDFLIFLSTLFFVLWTLLCSLRSASFFVCSHTEVYWTLFRLCVYLK